MRILAIDPGPKESAFVELAGEKIIDHRKNNNEFVLMLLRGMDENYEHAAIEMVASYGMPVGAEVFETVLWIGRFVEAIDRVRGRGPALINRITVKTTLCHDSRAKDANIRQALIDRFGGSTAIGKKNSPGPLYGITGDEWSALAVAITYMETNRQQ